MSFAIPIVVFMVQNMILFYHWDDIWGYILLWLYIIIIFLIKLEHKWQIRDLSNLKKCYNNSEVTK